MYVGKLKKPSMGSVVHGKFSMMPMVGRAFKIDNDGPMGGEMTSNVTEILESTGTYVKFKTIDSTYVLEFMVDTPRT